MTGADIRRGKGLWLIEDKAGARRLARAQTGSPTIARTSATPLPSVLAHEEAESAPCFDFLESTFWTGSVSVLGTVSLETVWLWGRTTARQAIRGAI